MSEDTSNLSITGKEKWSCIESVMTRFEQEFEGEHSDVESLKAALWRYVEERFTLAPPATEDEA